jgi:hypothetical protein
MGKLNYARKAEYDETIARGISNSPWILKCEHKPVTHGKLPPLQLRYLIDLEAKYCRFIYLGFERHCSRACRRPYNAEPTFLWSPTLIPRSGRDIRGFHGYHRRVDHEENVGECCPEVCAVDGAVSRRFRGIQVFAPWAVEFDGFLIGNVSEADGKERVRQA